MDVAPSFDSDGDHLTEAYRKKIEQFISQHVGIQLPRNKHTLIESRLRKRQRKLGISSIKKYVDYALAPESDNTERLQLIDALTTNKTDFYRESSHFAFLKDKIECKLANTAIWTSQAPFKAWSAGCSSGEEPYTLAIELCEIQRANPNFHFQIDATDISISCLKTAREGIYTFERIEPIPEPLRKRYLYKSKDRQKNLVAVTERLQNTVRFASFNLLTGAYEKTCHYDVIFCRNVLIYFCTKDRETIVQRLAHSLKPGGLLVIGHSETLSGFNGPITRLKPTIYQRNKNHTQ